MEKQTVPDENDSKRREDLKLLEKLRAITEKGDSALVKMKQDKLIIYQVTKKIFRGKKRIE